MQPFREFLASHRSPPVTPSDITVCLLLLWRGASCCSYGSLCLAASMHIMSHRRIHRDQNANS